MSIRLPMAEARREAGGTPPFARVAIVGCGLIGGSLGLAIKHQWPQALVIAVDRKDVIETAMRMHAADVGGDDLVLAAEANLVVLAAPVRENNQVLGRLADVIPGDALVTDVGSTKRETVAAAGVLPQRLRFIGGHPLAGAARGGVEGARPDLFRGRPWILTPSDADHHTTLELRAMLEAIGATVQFLPADRHDALVTYLSHLPQLVASALMHVVGTHAGVEGLALAGRGLRDTTRLASSPPDVWRDIVETNRDNIVPAVEELIAALRMQTGDPDADGLTRTFESAAHWKGVLDQQFEDPS